MAVEFVYRFCIDFETMETQNIPAVRAYEKCLPMIVRKQERGAWRLGTTFKGFLTMTYFLTGGSHHLPKTAPPAGHQALST